MKERQETNIYAGYNRTTAVKSQDLGLSPTKNYLSFFKKRIFKKVENPLLEQSELAIGTLNLDYRVFSISRAVPIYPVT